MPKDTHRLTTQDVGTSSETPVYASLSTKTANQPSPHPAKSRTFYMRYGAEEVPVSRLDEPSHARLIGNLVRAKVRGDLS
jgi:hypothetical protein